jgi:carbonic anhydrase
MEFFTNKTIPELLEKSLETARLTDSGWVDVGYELGSSAGRGIDWLTFEDARASVVDDVRRIREHPQLVPLTDHSIDAVGYLLGLSPRCVRVIQDFTFQPRHWIF